MYTNFTLVIYLTAVFLLYFKYSDATNDAAFNTSYNITTVAETDPLKLKENAEESNPYSDSNFQAFVTSTTNDENTNDKDDVLDDLFEKTTIANKSFTTDGTGGDQLLDMLTITTKANGSADEAYFSDIYTDSNPETEGTNSETETETEEIPFVSNTPLLSTTPAARENYFNSVWAAHETGPGFTQAQTPEAEASSITERPQEDVSAITPVYNPGITSESIESDPTEHRFRPVSEITTSAETTVQTSLKVPDDTVTETDVVQTQQPNNTESIRKRNLSKDSCYQRPAIELCEQRSGDRQNNTHVKPRRGAWYYDSVEMGCHYTSDCISNANAFESREECEMICLPPNGPSRCLAPPKAGYFQCSESNPSRAIAPLLMIFFDKITGKCRWFTYYGCGGSANRFQSIEECEATCGERMASKILMVASELCRVAPSTEKLRSWPIFNLSDYFSGSNISSPSAEPTDLTLFKGLAMNDSKLIEPGCPNIGQAESRWYLDPETETCKEFAYSHCGGSANNFLTRTDCEQFCGAKKERPEDICQLPADPGECGAPRQMWYYNPDYIESTEFGAKGACQTFMYTGCGGNANRFAEQATCEHTCGHLRRREEDSSDSLVALSTEQPSSSISESDGISIPSKSENSSIGKTANKPEGTDKQRNKTSIKEMHLVELMNIDIEPCRRPPLVGNCRPLNCSKAQAQDATCQLLSLQRWFFNAHTSNCEPFQYSGCGGSENTFDDAQTCQVACKARIVRPDRDRRCDSLPHHTKCYSLSLGGTAGRATNSTIAFHFSLGSATCKAFHLDTSQPGCDLLSYFSNGHECLRACVRSTPTEKHLQNRCFARKTHATWTCGSEQEKTNRWSYLSELNQCVQFSQCMPQTNDSAQPGNNFASRSICETTCMATSLEEVCQLPAERGPCHATQARYYYDVKAAKCRMFLYGGCLGNSNRFVSRQECESACGKFTSHVINQNLTASNETTDNGTPKGTEIESAPPVPAEVFDKMRRITQRHTDHFPWDVCLESHWYGTCPMSIGYHAIASGYPFTQLTRFFYDRRLGKCQPFTYTGCGARGNHFDTAKGCKEVCEDRLRNPKSARCREVNKTNLCPGSGIHGWAFNHSIGDCHSIEVCPTGVIMTPAGATQILWDNVRRRRTSHWLGTLQATTGQLPLGIYATRGACQYHCLPKPPRGTDAQNVCHMIPIVTVPFGCNAMVTRWYFEPREANCRSYITCPQYGNNFPSEKACRSICIPTHPLDVCRLPRDHGGCSQFQTRWHYDMNKRACVPFIYGGCFGNSNRFLSKAECESFCTAQDVCRLPLQRNSTDPTYPKRYYFDRGTGKCRTFHFTGILAHGNNFPTLEACNATCLSVPNLEVIGMDTSRTYSADGRDSSSEPNSLTTSSTKDVVLSSIDSRSSDIFVTEHKSLCVMSITDMGANELVEQTICEPEDIIHELGHRFRPIRTKNSQGEEVDGYCEQTLVPICLSEPRRVFGTIMDPLMHTIGRVFRTQSECEEICLNRRRSRRSVSQLPDLVQGKDELEQIVNNLLRSDGHDSDNTQDRIVRNGCSPEQSMAEQVDHFQHKFQAYSRWPCKFDTEKARNLVPMIERLAGSNVWLPCWIISAQMPKVHWVRLKDKKTYSITPIKIPALNNVWQAHLQLYRVDPFRHNGAWSCQVRTFGGRMNVEVTSLLHVIPKLFLKYHVVRQNQTIEPANYNHVTVPEGGTLLLGCRIREETNFSGYVRTPEFTWNRLKLNGPNGGSSSLVNLDGVELLHIKPVNFSQHSGLWVCGRKVGDIEESQIKFFVHVGKPPVFERPLLPQIVSVSKHQRTQLLQCGGADFGHPIGSLRWYRCYGGQKCTPVRGHHTSSEPNLLVYPTPGERYTCRIENMWGFVEQHFYFTF